MLLALLLMDLLLTVRTATQSIQEITPLDQLLDFNTFVGTVCEFSPPGLFSNTGFISRASVIIWEIHKLSFIIIFIN